MNTIPNKAFRKDRTLPFIGVQTNKYGHFCDDVKKMFQEEGIDVTMLSSRIFECAFTYDGQRIIGLGMKNDAGGMEFYNRNFHNTPITLKKKSHTTVRFNRRRGRGDTCLLLFGIDDYIAYEIIQQKKLLALPSDCDIIIVGHPMNFIQAMLDSESYEITYLLFPQTECCACAKKTMQTRNPNGTLDLSHIYGENSSLLQYLINETIKEKSLCQNNVKDLLPVVLQGSPEIVNSSVVSFQESYLK